MFCVNIKLKSVLLILLSATLGILLILFSTPAKEGIVNGLLLSANTVVPSLFLFTALSCFLFKSGCIGLLGKFISPVSLRLLGLDGEQFAVLLLSFISGYPVGASLIDNLYEKGGLSQKKAFIMLRFCINAGPAFIITAVGTGILGSKQDGIRLFLACFLSSITLLLISVPTLKKIKSQPKPQPALTDVPLSDIFVSSVTKASETMLSVSTFIVAFSGIGGIISSLSLPEFIKTAVLSTLEVTNGIKHLSRSNLPLIAFLLCFGGISVQMQAVSSAKNVKPLFLKLALWRVLGGVFAYFYIEIFELVSPRTNLVANMTASPAIGLSTGKFNPFSLGALLLMAITLAASTTKTLKYNT